MARRPLLLGHRGCRGPAAENTLAAFDLCLNSGCDGFEFDVRQTSDGKLVVVHDARCGDVAVFKSTYTQLLKQHLTSATVLLDDVLARYGSRAWLDIELKVAGMEVAVASLLRQYQPANYVLSSFLPEVLTAMHDLAPEIPLGLIFDDRGGLRRWQSLPVGHLMPNWRLVTRERLAEWETARKSVLVWTVNDPERMRQMAALGVHGIIADDPALLRSTLAGLNLTV